MGNAKRGRSMTTERRTEPGPDEALVARMARGERSALIELMARYRTSAYGVAYAILIDPEDAQAVVDEAFDDLWHRAKGFDPGRGSLYSGLTSLIRLLAERRLKARG
jgi:RNA polymerase sigma-70 factor, ECF subfamily